MVEFATVLSILLFLPFVAWGVHTLRLRYRRHEEIPVKIEAASLAGLVLFVVVQIILIRNWMGGSPVLFVFAGLGILVASAALYGHIIVSLVARLVVDVMMPTAKHDSNVPQMSPAEALERQGDYHGALQEYYVLARIFPKDPTVSGRVAETLMTLEEHNDAAHWFERTLSFLHSEESSLRITNRVVQVYTNQLDRPDEALRVLEQYIAKYPDAEYAASVRGRIDDLRGTTVLST